MRLFVNEEDDKRLSSYRVVNTLQLGYENHSLMLHREIPLFVLRNKYRIQKRSKFVKNEHARYTLEKTRCTE